MITAEDLEALAVYLSKGQPVPFISDKMRVALQLCALPYQDRDPWDVVEALSIAEGAPYKVALRRLEKAAAKGLVDYGTSIRGAWLTTKGLAAYARALKVVWPKPEWAPQIDSPADSGTLEPPRATDPTRSGA